MPKKMVVNVGDLISGMTVVELMGTDAACKSIAKVRCQCGVEVTARVSNLKSGNTKSCGCLNTRMLIARNTRHSLTADNRYQVWADMHKRCYSKVCKSYKNYGGRGIEVDSRWHGSPALFFQDMGPKPEGGTLERRNNDDGYNPSNCYWATMSDQQNNKRTSRKLTSGGITLTVAQWARQLGINRESPRWRLANGWSVDDAMSIKKGEGT